MISAITRAMVSVDPCAVAERLLQYLIDVHKAKGGAVLQWKSPRLLAFATVGTVAPLAAAREVWTLNLPALERGETVGGGIDTVLAPLFVEGALVGAVYLEGLNTCDLGDVAAPLAITLTVPAVPTRDYDISQMTRDQFEKEQLVKVLQAHEWNVARAARIIGVTRRTIYQRLERFGIERERVFKDPRRRSRGPATA